MVLPASGAQDIAAGLGVASGFDAEREIQHRAQFLADYLKKTGLKVCVLGISGGIDSLTAGLLVNQTIALLNKQGLDSQLIAVRLPYGHQHDEADALACIDVLQPAQVLTVNIKNAVDTAMAGLVAAGLCFTSDQQQDFILGNIKARQRMVSLYAIAGVQAGLVVGTEQAAEQMMGFFTKYGDGAADIMPLAGLTKRRVVALARHLGAPQTLLTKTPTADLESLSPMRPDEVAFGVTYNQIDDFLEGKPVTEQVQTIITRHWQASAHKRVMPYAPMPLDYS